MLLRVLYLDDEPDLCECFSDVFTSEGIQVTAYTDPRKAIAHALDSPPDLIFLDYRLSATTGDKVAQAMSSNTPKYLITGDISVNTTYKFAGVFRKPLEIEAIRSVLNLHLKAKATP